MISLDLSVMPGDYAVWKLPPDAPAPSIESLPFLSVTRTDAELSVVSRSSSVPAGVPVEAGWRCLGVAGPLSFDLTGIVAALTTPLAEAGVPVFVVSTFDTDYLLVRSVDLERACGALEDAGHRIVER